MKRMFAVVFLLALFATARAYRPGETSLNVQDLRTGMASVSGTVLVADGPDFPPIKPGGQTAKPSLREGTLVADGPDFPPIKPGKPSVREGTLVADGPGFPPIKPGKPSVSGIAV